MEFGTIEREIHVEASPEIVYQVVSTAEHLREWWPDDAQLDPVPGGAGRLTFGDPASPDAKTEPLLVVEADPPRRFSFRWVVEPGEVPQQGNSLLVTFDLTPVGDGTLLRLAETGFRERGWETAVLEESFADHTNGWDQILPRLGSYVARLVATS